MSLLLTAGVIVTASFNFSPYMGLDASILYSYIITVTVCMYAHK